MVFSGWVPRLPVLLLCGLAGACAGAGLPPDLAHKIDQDTWRKVESGETRDLLVLFADPASDAEAGSHGQGPARRVEDDAALSRHAARYRQIKARVAAAFDTVTLQLRKEYRHIPMSFVHIADARALRKLLASGDVARIYEDEQHFPALSQSLPLVGQPGVQGMGRTGVGTTVAVLDTGVDYSRSEFGACSAPGGAGCKVVAALDTAPDDGQRDANGHGTRVAGIVAAVAPGAGIAAIDVFNGGAANSSDIIEGIDWAIANRSAYNIVAINISIASLSKYTSPCTGNAHRQAIVNARNAGILSVVSSGNEHYTDGIASPACVPEAVSVGAVYDANVGSIGWSGCTDSSTAADRVACFSNSASFLTLLAPGAQITVAGATGGGTSYAAPHVAGAVAVLKAAFPDETPDQIQNGLTASGKSVSDSRNGIVTPRLDLLAAQVPANDRFVDAFALGGINGHTSGSNLLAGKEAGEPVHAGNTGGKSVWWQWTAPGDGVLSLDTHGSGFDTLLGVYTGAGVAALTTQASNDNDGTPGSASGVSLSVLAGTTYRIAVDGRSGAGGAVTLNWSLRQAQTISFPPIPDQPSGSLLALGASASSGLPVGYTSGAPAVCTVSGAVASFIATGICILNANQAGDAAYLPAAGESASCNVLENPETGGGGNPGTAQGDVPLPPWSLVLLGGGLYAMLARHRQVPRGRESRRLGR